MKVLTRQRLDHTNMKSKEYALKYKLFIILNMKIILQIMCLKNIHFLKFQFYFKILNNEVSSLYYPETMTINVTLLLN